MKLGNIWKNTTKKKKKRKKMIQRNSKVKYRFKTHEEGEKEIFGVVQKTDENGPGFYVHFGVNSEHDGWYHVGLLEEI